MIKNVKVKGFKAFADAEFEFSNLTLLCGMNGAGKSSLVQSILLMREICRTKAETVRLNGPFNLELGTLENIQNWDSQLPITFEAIDSCDINYKWSLSGNPASINADIAYGQHVFPDWLNGNHPGNFQYLSAERFGPHLIQSSSASPIDQHDVGVMGEHSAQVIHRLGSINIREECKFPFGESDDSSLLKFQTEQWLSHIARPIQLDTDELPGTGVIGLKFRPLNGDWTRSTNMGFGVSYSLPVVLAGLTSSNLGILLVESPEAHLHPAGQSNIGFFLAKIASSGTQVIIETHSDHVLNGIRRAIGQHKIISNKDAWIYYFSDGEKPKKLEFTPLGGIDHWPKGFFDQYQIDVTALSKVRRQS